MNHFPAAYQEWLFDALNLEIGDERLPALIEPLYHLNKQWVHTDHVMDYDTDEDPLRSYTLYYMTINMPKLWYVLENATIVLDADVESVMEFGCGPGTFLWSYLFYLNSTAPEQLKRVKRVRGIDRSPTALKYANAFADVLKRQPNFNHIEYVFEQGDWTEHVGEAADLAIFGNVLNEGPSNAFDADDLPFAHVAIIEPGTSQVFSSLLPLRDLFLESGWQLAFPCPTWETKCPMAGTENWCHFSINRFELPFIQRMSGQAKRLNPRHNFCALLFSKSEVTPDVTNWRCLSKLRKAHRSGIRWLCNGCHLVEAVLSRHSRSDANRPFLTANQGDLLAIDRPMNKNRVSPKATVRTVER